MSKTLIRPHSLLQTSCLMIALGLPSWQLASAQQTVFGGERVVYLLDEPHLRPVRQHGQLYLLDVRLKPGDESFAHVRNQTILLTHISVAELPAECIHRSLHRLCLCPAQSQGQQRRAERNGNRAHD